MLILWNDKEAAYVYVGFNKPLKTLDLNSAPFYSANSTVIYGLRGHLYLYFMLSDLFVWSLSDNNKFFQSWRHIGKEVVFVYVDFIKLLKTAFMHLFIHHVLLVFTAWKSVSGNALSGHLYCSNFGILSLLLSNISYGRSVDIK